MDNQNEGTFETQSGVPANAQPDTTLPSETEMPDASAIDERVKNGQLRQDAAAAFSGQAEGETPSPQAPENSGQTSGGASGFSTPEAQQDSIFTDAASSGAESSR